MTRTFDAVIAGAGIVGCACAYYLRRRGLRVALIDHEFTGSGATAAGMGHLVAMDDDDAQFGLTALGQRLWRELVPQLPSAVEHEPTGTLWLARDDEELAPMAERAERYRSRGLEAEVIDQSALTRLEPNVNPALRGAMRVLSDSVLYPTCAARALAKDAELIPGRAIRVGKGHVVLADGSRIDAGLVVNALGAWAPTLAPGLPIQPRKGHLIITDRYPGFVRHQLVELGYLKSVGSPSPESIAFNLQPRKTGQMLLGSSRQFSGWDDRVESRILGALVAKAREYVPAVTGWRAVRSWIGFRAATPDKLPLIGEWSPGVWVAAGHEGLGITTAPATGLLLASLAMGEEPPLDPAPFCPRRFVGA